jgi:hypothetical protein
VNWIRPLNLNLFSETVGGWSEGGCSRRSVHGVGHGGHVSHGRGALYVVTEKQKKRGWAQRDQSVGSERLVEGELPSGMGTWRRYWSMNRNGSGAAFIPRSGTSPPSARPCSIPLSASEAALLPSAIWRRPCGFQAAMRAALGLGGGSCLPAGGELLKAADCRAAAGGGRWAERRFQFEAGLTWKALHVWRVFLQNIIYTKPASLNLGPREYYTTSISFIKKNFKRTYIIATYSYCKSIYLLSL